MRTHTPGEIQTGATTLENCLKITIRPEYTYFCVHQKLCIRIFIETLFLIAPNWKLLQCSPTVEHKLCYIHKMEYNEQ